MSEAKAQAEAAKKRQLPPKEAALFKELLQQYELKQVKKGVKVADQILKKFPNHGETLAIKSLIIHSSLPFNHPTASSVSKGAEAESLIAAALRKDPYSHITHHVQAIIHRANKDFQAAHESLQTARSLDMDNIPLLRDSISLSTQLGKHEESLAARHQYFTMRPNMRTNWITLAVGHELCGDYEEALRILEGLVDVTKDEGLSPIEKTQLSWHTIRIMSKFGKKAEALELLEDDMRDRIIPSAGESLEVQAQLFLDLDQQAKAEEVYRNLLEANPDRLAYYKSLLKCKGIDFDGSHSDEQTQKILTILDGFAENYPRAAAPKRLALTAATGDEFHRRAEEYLLKGLEKGIPSLFVDIKGLYVDREKMNVVESILVGWQAKLEADEPLNEKDDELSEPTTLLWLYYFLALHLSHRSHPSPDYQKSLSLLDRAIQHTPTLPEIHMARAMILKRAGDPERAAREMEFARLLDGQDRFLNGKAGKYWLRAGEVEKATQVLGLFTKKDAISPGQDLRDMQCNWFLIEEGNAHMRAGRLGPALKRYEQVISVFRDIDDDAYDFHSYCIRKMTLNPYLDMVSFEDHLQSFPKYINAAISASQIYLQIYDKPDLKEQKFTPEEEAERRKAQKKAQKADSKAKKSAPPAPADGKKDEPTLPDADPEGSQYLKECDPLKAIEKLLAPLYRVGSDNIDFWFIAFEVAMRKKRNLQAARAISAARSIKASDPRLHSAIIRMALAKPEEEFVKKQSTDLIPEGISLERYNSEFLQNNPSSAAHIFQAAISLRLILLADAKDGMLSSSGKEQVEGIISEMLGKDVVADGNVYDAATTFLIRDVGSEDSVVSKFRQGAKARLPLAMKFASAAEREDRRSAWAKEDASKVAFEANGTA